MNLGAAARGAAAFGASAGEFRGGDGLLFLKILGGGHEGLGQLGGVLGREADRHRPHAEVHNPAGAALDATLPELREESKLAGHAPILSKSRPKLYRGGQWEQESGLGGGRNPLADPR